MTVGLRALLHGVIDYAGLFPPARLPLQKAVAEYLEIRKSPEEWLLGRFVIPAGDVIGLADWAEDFHVSDKPLSLALIGRSSDTVDDCHGHLLEDLYDLAEFVHGTSSGRCNVSLELPLPRSLANEKIPTKAFAQFDDHVGLALDETGIPFDSVFVEVPANSAAVKTQQSLILAITTPRFHDRGFKLRTGGLKADAFPTVAELADVVRLCQQNCCPWKATAGLHHPLPRDDQHFGVKRHGFLNVLFAAVLADAHDFTVEILREILADEDAANFYVTDDGIRWGDYAATIQQIETARTSTFQSFGSCSFNEPRDDLKQLGLL